MKRRMFNIVAAGSLVLLVASFALWVRSATHFEMVQVRYARWPRADEHRMYYFSFAWYSSTLRMELSRTTRLPANFRRMLTWYSEADFAGKMERYRAGKPAGMQWEFLGEDVTLEMNGFRSGFAARHWVRNNDVTHPGESWVLAVRPWAPTLLTAVLPAVFVWRFVRVRRERRRGLCAGCGYDMRATPDRCPECGAAAT